MGKYSDQPEWTTEDKETDIYCPFCGAINLFKYQVGKEAEFQCHSCYSNIGVTIEILHLPGDSHEY